MLGCIRQGFLFLIELLIIEGSDEFSPGTSCPVLLTHGQDFVQ